MADAAENLSEAGKGGLWKGLVGTAAGIAIGALAAAALVFIPASIIGVQETLAAPIIKIASIIGAVGGGLGGAVSGGTFGFLGGLTGRGKSSGMDSQTYARAKENIIAQTRAQAAEQYTAMGHQVGLRDGMQVGFEQGQQYVVQQIMAAHQQQQAAEQGAEHHEHAHGGHAAKLGKRPENHVQMAEQKTADAQAHVLG